MFYNALTKERKKVLPLLKNFKKEFYLAGGTALALQLGHRDSIDFDFFTDKNFSTKKLFEKIKKIFKNRDIKKIQEEKNTLTIIVNKNIKISFLNYPYKFLGKLINEEYFRVASIIDIACMKLSAIVSRAAVKDYVDIYFILKKIPLNELLKSAEQKFPDLDTNLILKSLVYFEDIDKEPIKFRNNNRISFNAVKLKLIREVKSL